MRHSQLLFLLAIVAIPVAIFAQSQRAQSQPAAQGTFLEPEKEYLIGFPEDSNPFTGYNGSACEIFRVVRVHRNGSWILVEHPALPTDYGTWHLKHSAPFLPKHSTEITDAELASIKKSGSRTIELEQTWINLDHAVTVKSVSARSLGLIAE